MKNLIWLQFELNVFLGDGKPVLVQVTALASPENKLLPKPLLTKIPDAIWRH